MVSSQERTQPDEVEFSRLPTDLVIIPSSCARNHIKHSSDRLREIISEPAFVAHFGEPRPHPKGKRQNVFGAEDELKTAPKGVDKNHK